MANNPRYCPTDWLDEVNPMASTPEEFARRTGNEWLLIDPELSDNQDSYFKDNLEPGQVVNFSRLTTYEDFALTVHDDGSHTAHLPEFDGNAQFRLTGWEWEDSVDGLEELIKTGHRDDFSAHAPLRPGGYIVECWAWRDSLPYRFEPQGDAPKFVLCAGAN